MAEVPGPKALRELLDTVLILGAELDLPAMLRRITQAAAELVDAASGAFAVLNETGTRVTDVITVGADDWISVVGGLFWPTHSVDAPNLEVPIRVRGGMFGTLYLADKAGGGPFTAVDEALVDGLAAAASVAIENTRLHIRIHELGLVEERERIARNLHDTVIQRLFATGLSLQTAARLVETDPKAAVERVEAGVDALDVTVKHIRTAIFGLENTRALSDSLRSRVLELIRDAAGSLGFEPSVVFGGPLDTTVSPRQRAEVLATLEEAISNVVRHAGAQRLDVEVIADDDITIRVVDDGVGPPTGTAPAGHGLRNMGARAHRLGGTFSLTAGSSGGTVLEWRVPRA